MEDINKDQKEFWNGQKGNIWVSLEQKIDEMLDPLGDAALKVLAPKTNERVLDIGCGTATTTLKIAKSVGDNGLVTGVDISKPILECARQKAKKKLKHNIDFILADGQNHKFEFDSYDAVFSRFGVMFFGDAIAAFSNLKKATKTGGRLTFVCWADRLENEWMEVSTKVASQFLELPPKSAPKEPGPFAFEDLEYLKKVLVKAGWSKVEIKKYSTRNSVGRTVKESANFLSRMGPMSVPFEGAEEAIKRKVILSLEKSFSNYLTDNGVKMNFSTWIVTAQKD